MKISRCKLCDKELEKDWIALHKKLLDKNAKDFYCIYCLADTFNCEVADLEVKIEEFREAGCTLFH